MSRDEQDRLRDIQDAITAIHKHLEQAGETTAAKEDPLLHDALLFQFEKRVTQKTVPVADQRKLGDGHKSSNPLICRRSVVGVDDRIRTGDRLARKWLDKLPALTWRP